MLIGDSQKFLWGNTPCHIEGDSITTEDEYLWQYYNPFDRYYGHTTKGAEESLYISFLKVETDEQALAFVNKYGFLGMEGNWTTLLYIQLSSKEQVSIISASERIADIKREAARLRTVVGLSKPLNDQDAGAARRLLVQLREFYIPELTEAYRLNVSEDQQKRERAAYVIHLAELMDIDGNDNEVLSSSVTAIQLVINMMLSNVRPNLSGYSKEGKIFESSWNVKSLLEAMYFMLFLDLNRGLSITQCESRTCDQYFTVDPQSEKIKRFCSERCRYRQHKWVKRHEKKESEE